MTQIDVYKKYGLILDKLFIKCAKVIDDTWRYSWHWGKEPDKRHWTMDAKHNCIERIQYLEKELSELRLLRKELEEIAPLFIPDDK